MLGHSPANRHKLLGCARSCRCTAGHPLQVPAKEKRWGFSLSEGITLLWELLKRAVMMTARIPCFVFKLQAQITANIQLSFLGIVASQMCYIAFNLYLTCLLIHRRYRSSKRMGVILLLCLITPFHFQTSCSPPIVHKILIQTHEIYSSLDFWLTRDWNSLHLNRDYLQLFWPWCQKMCKEKDVRRGEKCGQEKSVSGIGKGDNY